MLKRILIIVTTAAGIFILFRAFCIFEQSREALNWPQTKGRMISSLLTIEYLPKFIDHSFNPTRWFGTHVEYEYSFNGMSYLSNRLSFQNGNTRSPKEALKVMNKYRRLNEVTVYYNPHNPLQSVLEPEDIGDIIIPVMVGGLLVFCGLLGFYKRPLDLKRGRESLVYQGQIYQDQGKTEEALWHYTEAIRSNPNLAMGYSNRGSIFIQQKEWDQAIVDFTRAIEIDPNDALAYFAMAKAYVGKQQYDQAWEFSQKALEKGFNVSPEMLEDIKSKLS